MNSHRSLHAVKWALNLLIAITLLLTPVCVNAFVAPPLPPSPTTSTTSLDQTGESQAGSLQPPIPGKLPLEVELQRVQAAMEATLRKRLDSSDNRFQALLGEVKIVNNWAVGTALWQGQDKPFEEPIYLLAHRQPDFSWQALMASTNGLYLSFLEELPVQLASPGLKSDARRQAGILDDLTRLQDTPQPTPTPIAPALKSSETTQEKRIGSNPDGILWPLVFDAGKLPWRCGESVRVTQNRDNPGYSHTGSDRWAWDFGNGQSEWPVYATRDGTVAVVETGYATNSGCSSCNWTTANRVVVDHGNQTAGLYLHLAQESPPRLRVGDQVRAGVTIVGNADNTGWTSGPHLHYAVQRWNSNWNGQAGRWYQASYESLFSDPNVPDGNPRYPNWYVSGNCPPPSTAQIRLVLGSYFRNRSVGYILVRGDGRVVEAGTKSTDNDGTIAQLLPPDGVEPGDYRLGIKPQGYVRRTGGWPLIVGQNTITLPMVYWDQCTGLGGGCGGDANNDNRVGLFDFEIWRSEQGPNTGLADFNGDGRVDLSDFEIWRRGYLAEGDGSNRSAAIDASRPTDAQGILTLITGESSKGDTEGGTVQSIYQVGETVALTLGYFSVGAAMGSADATVDFDQCVLELLDDQITDVGPFDQTVWRSATGALDYGAWQIPGAPAAPDNGNLIRIPFRVIASTPDPTRVVIRYDQGSTSDSNMVDRPTVQDFLIGVVNANVTTSGAPQRPQRTTHVSDPPAVGVVNQNAVLLAAEAQDPCAEIDQVTFYVQYDGAWHEVGVDTYGADGWSMYWDASQVSDQIIAVKTFAGDRAGNGVFSPVNESILLDRNPPPVSQLSFAPEIATVGDTVLINVTANDPPAITESIKVYVDPSSGDPSPWGSWNLLGEIIGSSGSVAWNTEGYSPGTHQIVFVISDSAGNEIFRPLADEMPISYDLDAACLDITAWKGEYWNNETLSRPMVLCRNDPALDFEWYDGAPDPVIQPDHFSARWTRTSYFDSGTYRFHVSRDDGARLWVDNNLILDAWQDGREEHFIDYALVSGYHEIRFEMYENEGWARSSLSWQLSDCNDLHEPNGSPGSASAMLYGETVSAMICPAGDQDFYTFVGGVGDQIVIDIDATINGSALDSYVYVLDSDGYTVLAENDDERPGIIDSKLGFQLPHSGTFYIRTQAYWHPYVGGADHFYTMRLFIDDQPPISASITSPLNDDWMNPSWQDIAVDANDLASGVQRVEFLWHDSDWTNPDWTWLGADYNGDDGWVLGFDSGSQPEQRGGAFYVWAFDWVGNWTSTAVWNLGIDRTPPVPSVLTMPLYGSAPFRDFWVDWRESTDNLSGINASDVQVSDNGGSWTNLWTNTALLIDRFVGENGHSYNFRVRSRDMAGNLSDYVVTAVPYTVQVCPVAPDTYEPDNLATSASWIVVNGTAQSHNMNVEQDVDWVKFSATAATMYTLATSNPGGHADTQLWLYSLDGSTLIASNDDYPGMGMSSRIDWQPTASGTYYAKVDHWDPWAFGCTTLYGLSITTACALIGDVNNDGVVNVFDVQEVANRWGSTVGNPNYSPQFDLNSDGNISVVDIMIVSGHWGSSC